MHLSARKAERKTRPLHILCADDNVILGEIMLCLLAREGHWVEQVGDGAKAWDRLSADIDSFDVLVTDHQMPGLTGLELVERLRSAPKQRLLPMASP